MLPTTGALFQVGNKPTVNPVPQLTLVTLNLFMPFQNL